ncbi:Uncharacterised protein [Clostridioides difficile]|nr:Uncharacterised protein [Clostridioides difficile]VIF34743.1 Uncharacterised protein [Clostridioides difficile]VIF48154.1 Uncharacterised protein [Clostridioides difficile]
MFCINATAANTAPTIAPSTVRLVPENLFTAATATKTTTTNAIIPAIIQKIGQDNNAALKPHCAAVACAVTKASIVCADIFPNIANSCAAKAAQDLYAATAYNEFTKDATVVAIVLASNTPLYIAIAAITP